MSNLFLETPCEAPEGGPPPLLPPLATGVDAPFFLSPTGVDALLLYISPLLFPPPSAGCDARPAPSLFLLSSFSFQFLRSPNPFYPCLRQSTSPLLNPPKLFLPAKLLPPFLPQTPTPPPVPFTLFLALHIPKT